MACANDSRKGSLNLSLGARLTEAACQPRFHSMPRLRDGTMGTTWVHGPLKWTRQVLSPATLVFIGLATGQWGLEIKRHFLKLTRDILDMQL